MRLLKILSAVFAAGILFNSCNNKLNILAPYKEQVSVYAVLNPQDKVQYIRINKIFLGEGNAYDMAKVSDSVNYQPGELNVTLERFVNGIQTQPAVGQTKNQILLRDTVVTTAPGMFNTQQRLYYTTDKLYTNGDYKLTIKNNHTGNVFTSQTTIIDSCKYISLYAQPLGGAYYPIPYDPVNDQAYWYVDYSLPSTGTKVVNVGFYSSKNTREYSCIVRFNYIDSLQGGVTVPHYVDFKLSSLSTTDLTGNEQLKFVFDAADFINTIYSTIVKNGDPANFYSRRAIKLDYFITGASQDLVDFIYISAPSTSVAQDKPAYSNINGGFGIFGARSRFWVQKQMASNFIIYMSSKKPLCQLRFVNTNGQISSSCN